MICTSLLARVSGSLLLIVLWQLTARGEDLDLRLEVEGFIYPTPSWRNDKNDIIDHLTFRFDGASRALDHGHDVDSNVQSAKLVDLNMQAVTVNLRRPQSCSIGLHPIENQHVHLVHRRHAHTKDADIQIREGEMQDFQLRFSRQGNYGHLTGAVACSLPGMLRYTYQ